MTGGESIRDMQNQTGCKINVSSASGRDIEREIGLIGTRHAIEAAKRAILDKVETVVSLPWTRDRTAINQRQRARSQNREPSRDEYADRYSAQPQAQPQHHQAPIGYPAAAAGPPQAGAPPAGGADPYAAYGGYQNYLNMWYAAMAAQQGGQGPGEQR